MKNQCDGCQAGIPVVNGTHRMGREGGYPDLMGCTKKQYVEIRPEPSISTGHPAAGRVYAEALTRANATIAEQAKMIEHLRGGLIQGAPIAWCTEDHLTDKSATTYDSAMAERWRAKGWPVKPLYDKPSEHPSGFTGVDMADSSADGRRSLAEYLIKQIAIEHPDQDTLLTVKYIAQWIALETGL